MFGNEFCLFRERFLQENNEVLCDFCLVSKILARLTLQIFFQDPFDPDEFVERLAWRTTGGMSRNNPDDFDPMAMHAAFEKTIKDLKTMNIRMEKKVSSYFFFRCLLLNFL